MNDEYYEWGPFLHACPEEAFKPPFVQWFWFSLIKHSILWKTGKKDKRYSAGGTGIAQGSRRPKETDFHGILQKHEQSEHRPQNGVWITSYS